MLKARKAYPRNGAMAVLIAICLPMLLTLLVMFVGIAQMQLARSEMRVAADAAARAATEAIIRTENEEAAYQKASRVIVGHSVSKERITLERNNVVFGQGSSQEGAEWEFIPHQKPYNAAQVQVVKSTQSPSGPVSLLLSFFGTPHFETAQSATASQVDHDIIFVIEAGGSMHAPQRWNGVLEALEQIVALVPTLGNKTRVGVVVCHQDPVLAQELAPANGEFVDRMIEIHDSVKNVKLVQGRNLGGGLELASNHLEAQKRIDYTADQTILFLGNGDQNQGVNPIVAAKTAVLRNQVIYAFVFGHNSDKEGLMESSALITGGKFFDVQELSILPGILREVLFNPSIVLIR